MSVELPPLAPRRKAEVRTDGRNIETFDRVRIWAYAQIGEYRCGPRETWVEDVAAGAIAIAEEVRAAYPDASHAYTDAEALDTAKSVAGYVDRSVPRKLDVHLIMDNYATHKHADVKEWFAAHPRYHVHFTPASSSWLNAVERFFAEITHRRIRRGTFGSVAALKQAITAYVNDHNKTATPFIWTKSARTIIRK